MARAENQKLKALYVAKYILENSDENHEFNATDIVDYLEEDHGIIADRRSIYPEGDKYFVVSADVEISEQFYGWLCGFGKRVKIISPPSAVEDFKAYLQKISSMY